MEPILIALLAILLSIIAYALLQIRKKNKYWEERGIPSFKPKSFFGNISPMFFAMKEFCSLRPVNNSEYQNEPIIGINEWSNPVLIIKKYEIIEKILIKDFIHFTDRGFPNDRRNVHDINLFSLTGKEWRALRYKLSPFFTTGKLKNMFGTMAECGEALTSLLDSENMEDVDMREILGRFSMDVVGSCAYGIDAKNLSQPDSEFRKMGKKTSEVTLLSWIKFGIIMNFPKLAKILRLSFTRRDVAKYFCKVIRDMVEYRRKNNISRNDFLQWFMLLKEKGSIELQIKDPADDYLKMEPTFSIESFEFDEDMMVGQAFTFLVTGFETTTAAELFALYEIAKNPDIQDKVRKEILKQVEAAGSLTYDAIRQMTYLEQCVKETLRKYPPAGVLARICTKEYTLPNGLEIPLGQSIIIPITAVHYDSEYYPEPEEFRPERFDPDHNIPPGAFIPFGNGPRICIAMRFALMQVNYCLAKLLMNYEFRISPKTKPFELSTFSVFVATKYPILFNVKKIAAST